MKKFIINSNEWYDDLPEFKRLAFFLIVILGSLIAVEWIAFFTDCILLFPIWVLLFCSWRMSYTIINWFEWYKDQN